jgi:hypothetical protein
MSAAKKPSTEAERFHSLRHSKSPEEIEEVRQRYLRNLCSSPTPESHRISQEEILELRAGATQSIQTLGDYKAWLETTPRLAEWYSYYYKRVECGMRDAGGGRIGLFERVTIWVLACRARMHALRNRWLSGLLGSGKTRLPTSEHKLPVRWSSPDMLRLLGYPDIQSPSKPQGKTGFARNQSHTDSSFASQNVMNPETGGKP